jgi:hypothetical protein
LHRERGRMISWIPPSLAGCGIFSALLQAIAPVIPPGDVASIAASVEHLSLVGALGLAVVMLWRSNTKKDDQLVEATKKTQEALVSTAEHLRVVIETNRQLTGAIQGLQVSIARLPCTAQVIPGTK